MNTFIVFGGQHNGVLLNGELSNNSVMLFDGPLIRRYNKNKFVQRKEFNTELFNSKNGRYYHLAILNDAIDVDDEEVRERIETIITKWNPDFAY